MSAHGGGSVSLDKVLFDTHGLAADALESMADGVICADLDGYITHLNAAAEVMTGWSRRAAAGRRLDEVVVLTPQTGSRYAGGPAAAHGRLVGSNGTAIDVEAAIAPMSRRGGQTVGTVTVLRNVGAALEMSQRMVHLAHHDVLTGLPNRVLLRDRLAVAIALATRRGKALAVGFLDLDGFKNVNDSLGHAAGDDVLRTIAARLLGELRHSDSVARYGGDEFVFVLSEIEHASDCTQVGTKLLQAIARPIRVGTQDVTVSASLGMAICPTHGLGPEALIANADAAMYDAKRAEGMPCQIFRSEARPSSAGHARSG